MVLEFIMDGTVGLRLIANAEAIYKTRKSEIECEDLLEDMNGKYRNALLSKPFYDAEKHVVTMDSFDDMELKAFFDTASQSIKELQDLPASRKKSGPMHKSPLQRAADMQIELWATLKANFKAMYNAVIEDVMGLAVEALQNDGADMFGVLVDFADLFFCWTPHASLLRRTASRPTQSILGCLSTSACFMASCFSQRPCSCLPSPARELRR